MSDENPQTSAAPTVHETVHEIEVDAPADAVYDLVADAARWPVHFPPNLHVDVLEGGGGKDGVERLRIWATANGAVKNWTSRRELDRAAGTVTFRQERSQAPVASMGGTWHIEPLGEGRTRVRFTHTFTAVGDDPENVDWIRRAIDTNTASELQALRAGAETAADGLVLTFDDTVRVAGSAKDAYEFIRAADRWTERLPHVARVSLTEDVPGEQILEMDTRTADGSTHTTTSVRICFPAERIVYKQIHTPALMDAHTGEWIFEEDGDGCVVTSRHTVRIAPGAVRDVLGPDADVARARTFVREALGRNSRATLGHAAAHADGLRAAGPVGHDVYVSVQRFYAEQMRHLDEGRAEEWAATFTEDGVFGQNAGPEPVRGRTAIAAAVRANQARLAADPQQRRHVFAMLTVDPAGDGAVRARSYAQVLVTRPGGPTVLHLSAVCEDELVPAAGGWAVRHRRVDHDGA
ncbi:nuclear transport factor 2 family protein [Streptomyces sp. NPDC047141]|uniref:nuclear transport factor 2 family protein n=1 Tax=Streptomyces sp. NPDC047141 TaxID=3155738 RepID=UPI0033DDA9CA